MTKPEFASEPTMEDILASIRKMISEDRLGPRPVPDQIGRNSYGDGARSGSEPGNFDLQPQRTERAPAQADRLPAERAAGDRSPAERSDRPLGDRPMPSYSSLSNAIKSGAPANGSAPASTPRRTLEEKIADMLSEGSGVSGFNAGLATAPSDALAVFAAKKAAPSPSAQQELGGAGPSVNRPATPAPSVVTAAHAKPALGEAPPVRSPDATPSAPQRAPSQEQPVARADERKNEAPQRSDKAPDVNADVPPRSHTAPAPRESAPVRESSPASSGNRLPGAPPREAAPSRPQATTAPADKAVNAPAGEPKSDTQRIIAMPTRLPAAASGTGHAGAVTNGALNGGSMSGAAMNGAPVAPFGLRTGASHGANHAANPAPAPSRVDRRAEADALLNGPKVPRVQASEAAREGYAGGSVEKAASVDAAVRAAAASIVTPPKSAASPSSEESGLPPAETAAAKPTAGPMTGPMTGMGPSEALVDAMVNLVHNEPSSLSVFTSGSAFIHGVATHATVSDDDAGFDTHAAFARAENDGSDHSAFKQPATRKLDRSAAELLRPMLRQWLADNMPRIVEEALRSELVNSQQADKDSEGV